MFTELKETEMFSLDKDVQLLPGNANVHDPEVHKGNSKRLHRTQSYQIRNMRLIQGGNKISVFVHLILYFVKCR